MHRKLKKTEATHAECEANHEAEEARIEEQVRTTCEEERANAADAVEVAQEEERVRMQVVV